MTSSLIREPLDPVGKILRGIPVPAHFPGSYPAASFIVRMQNGCLDTYILYVFLAVVVVIVLLGVLL